MKLPDLSVRRPVTTAMVFLGVIILGFISWTRLPQELFPPINYPQITVATTYEGAAPEEIETLVTKIIEEAVGTVSSIKRISSTSRESLSLVMAEFDWGTNMDFAALDVREKIDLIKERLPREGEEPIVMKFNPFDSPVVTLSITGEKSSLELREITRRIIKNEIEKIEGVAQAEISGGEEREIIVEVDQGRLQASGISLIDVVDFLKAANLNYPAGTIKEAFYEYLVRTMGAFKEIKEIAEIATGVDDAKLDTRGLSPKAIKEKEKEEGPKRRLIFLKDIARIRDTVKERTSISRYNGEDNISIFIKKQSGANTLRVANRVREAVKKLTQKLPQGINIDIVYDSSFVVKEAIAGVRDAALFGGILAFFILLFFLRSVRSSLIVSAAIPVSILATFSLMFFGKISLNMMSLGGLALGVGMLVDNAVVVMESIFRAKGSDAKDKAIKGANEVTNAIIASTLTTICVFLPMIFVVGITGQLFKELAFTVTFSLVASLIVALSLIPVLSARGGRSVNPFTKRIAKNIVTTDSDGKTPTSKLRRLEERYPALLSRLLKYKGAILLITLVLFLLSLSLFSTQKREFLPRVDQKQFIIKVDLNPGARLKITDFVVKKIENILFSIEEVKDVTVTIGSSRDKTSGEKLETMGSHQAQIMVNIRKDFSGSKARLRRSTPEVIQYLRERLEEEELEGADIEYIAQESVFPRSVFGEGTPIVIEVKGYNLAILEDLSRQIQNAISPIEGIYGVKNSFIPPAPETKVNILKDRASFYNLSARDIALTMQIGIQGYTATKFKDEGREIDIKVRLREEDRRDFNKLRNILIRSPLGMSVPLSQVAYITQGVGPSEIKRLDQQRTILVSANIFDRSLDQVVNDVNAVISKIREPGYTVVLGGESKRMKESFGSLRFALIFAILGVYMIMAAQFESLWQPLVIIFTLPLSLIGVSLALAITQTPLSVVVFLGLIMLGGIVVNNGIVLVDYINILRGKGLGIYEAVITASQVRLRPILMTALTTILGLFPLALGMGVGSELRTPLAIAVIGGLMSATFLTLIVIPAIYLSVAPFFAKFSSLPAFSPKRLLSSASSAALSSTLAPGPEFGPELEPEVSPERSHSAPKPISPLPKPKATETPPAAIGEPPVTVKRVEKAEKREEVERPEKSEKEEKPEKAGLNKRQTSAINYLKQNKKITRKDYANTFNISVPTAARDLKELIDKGFVIAKGPLGPGRYYELK